MNHLRQMRLTFFPGASLSVTADDRQTMRLLEQLAKGHAECWSHTKTIAARLGIGVRACQVRLRRLVDLGYLRSCWDYTRRARRRLVLLWLETPGLEAGLEAGFGGGSERNDCAESAQRIALSSVVPPDPPIEGSEDNSERGGSDGDNLEVEVSAELPPPPPDWETLGAPETPEADPEPETVAEAPGTLQDEPTARRRVASPAEVSRLRKAAVKAVPDDPTFPAWVTRLAKTWGLSWVLPAAELVAEKSQEQDIRNPRGFTIGVLKTFEADGGPPPIGPDPEAEAAYWRQRLIEALK